MRLESILLRVTVLVWLLCPLAIAQERLLKQGESPVVNPLKGLVPYARPAADRFPHSMEFSYIGLAKIVMNEGVYDWQPMEKLLDDIASRGNQAVIRIYLEYPGKSDGIPQFLIDGGLKVHSYMNTNTAPFPPTKVLTPNYEDESLRKTLVRFIQALGAKYDGDPRLGFITAGLLGTWGEWHTYPRDDLWASKLVQSEVMDAYEQSFRKTPILLRYPAGDSNWDKAANDQRPFGYHDDSLCWATLETGKKSDDWFFVPALKSAGKRAVDKWKSAPIGGEIRPEVWGKIFDDQVEIPQAQSFERCASEIHLSWTMDTGMFRDKASKKRLANALQQTSKLGYDFYVDKCTFPNKTTSKSIEVDVHVINQGIAPFYYDWAIELSAFNQDGGIVKTWATDWSLKGVLPDAVGTRMNQVLDLTGMPKGEYVLLMRIANPLQGGKPVQFSNSEWNSTMPGWLTLGKFDLIDE